MPGSASARIDAYPAAFQALAALSHRAPQPVTSQTAARVAVELNQWLYSAGGMLASATTRKAVIGLRRECRRWGKEGGDKPPALYEIRNLVLRCLRLDLDQVGLESGELTESPSWLSNLQQEVAELERRTRTAKR